MVTDREGSIVYVNEYFTKMTGYANHEVLGKSPSMLKSGNTLASTYRQMWATITAGSTWKGELVNRKKDGTVYYEYAVIAPIFNEQGIATHYLSVREDITRSKQAEERLRLSEHRMHLLAENARDVIWTMSPEGKMTYLSSAVRLFRGFDAAECLQQTLADMLAPASHVILQRYIQQLHSNLADNLLPPNFQGELEYLCKDGSTVWADVLLCPLFDDEGVVELLGMTRDISEHRRRRSELEGDAKRLAEQIVHIDRQRALGQMSAALGHELNQPLTAILSNCQVMQRGLRDNQLGAEKIGELIERIIQNTRRASGIIQGIRTFIRPTQREHRVVCLQEVVRETLELIHADAQQHRVRLRFDDSASPVTVLGDKIQLSQVLLNILRNAIEVLQQVAYRDINIQITQTTELVHLRITDSGSGLTPQQLEMAGTPFFSTKRSGLGIGLSICKKIVADHNGTLVISNAQHAGARIEITLPIST